MSLLFQTIFIPENPSLFLNNSHHEQQQERFAGHRLLPTCKASLKVSFLKRHMFRRPGIQSPLNQAVLTVQIGNLAMKI